MAENYVLLETIALSQTAASVTFDNIPQTGYTDLKIVFSVRSTNSSANWDPVLYRFNASTSGYSTKEVYGTGSSTGSASSTTITSTAAGGTWGRIQDYGITTANQTTSTFSNAEFHIHNYLSGNVKSGSFDSVYETNATAAYTELIATLWNDTPAITNISFALKDGSYAAGSTFSLYGVAKLGTTPAIAPFATGGNIVANDGTYWYHAFLSSGTFTPLKALSCDALVIAGGGGGLSGGGGAGGLLAYTSQSLSTINYSVTVGAGGASYTNGTNSTLQTLAAATGGGAGGGNSTTNPAGNGGSGGGSMGLTSSPLGALAGGTGVAGPPRQGYDGGAGFWGNAYAGGGGGGAGAVGGNSSTTNPSVAGNGGVGVNTYSSWATATTTGVSGFFAGGGGGASNLAGLTGGTAGSGGSGGGGAGVLTATGNAATANTGGGGGGGGTTGGAGGSGIILIRYPMV